MISQWMKTAVAVYRKVVKSSVSERARATLANMLTKNTTSTNVAPVTRSIITSTSTLLSMLNSSMATQHATIPSTLTVQPSLPLMLLPPSTQPLVGPVIKTLTNSSVAEKVLKGLVSMRVTPKYE